MAEAQLIESHKITMRHLTCNLTVAKNRIESLENLLSDCAMELGIFRYKYERSRDETKSLLNILADYKMANQQLMENNNV